MSFSKGHALLAGIGTYSQEPQLDILVSKTDGEGVREVLIDPDYCGYVKDQVNFLHDETATREGLLAALKELASRIKPDDTLFFFYVGHGSWGTDGYYYLTTHDTKLDGSRVKKGTGVSEVELLGHLRDIQAKRVLVIVNSCHSGKLSPNLGPGQEEPSPGEENLPENTAAALLSTGEGRIIITACRSQQKSWIGQGKISLFTQALVTGLRGEGYVPNNQGYISAFGLYEHVYSSTKASAAKLNLEQEPVFTALQNVGPFPVALYHGATDINTFNTQEAIPDLGATSLVDPADSGRLYEVKVQSIQMSGNETDSTYIAGNSNTVQNVIARNGSKVSGVHMTVNNSSSSTKWERKKRK
jgi:hypothetical protein